MEFLIYDSKISCIDNNGMEVGKITFPKRENNVYEIKSTKVDESMRGQGIAGKLMRLCLNEINLRDGEVEATCSYAQKYIEKHGLRPLVICHMMTSIDGKVTGAFLTGKTGTRVSETYYELNRKLKGDAFACGRVTMESSFTGGFEPDLSAFQNAEIFCEDFIAQKHNYYAISFDRHGKVGWTESLIHDSDSGYDDCHIIEVLCEDASKEMMAYYRSIGVSYIFAGKNDIDINLALNKLYSLFGIKKLLLEGGSIINGAFLRSGAVDNISQVIAPVIADKEDKHLFFDADMTDFRMLECKDMKDGSVWIWYAR